MSINTDARSEYPRLRTASGGSPFGTFLDLPRSLPCVRLLRIFHRYQDPFLFLHRPPFTWPSSLRTLAHSNDNSDSSATRLRSFSIFKRWTFRTLELRTTGW